MKKIGINGFREIHAGKRRALLVREIHFQEGMISWSEWPAVDNLECLQEFAISPADGYYGNGFYGEGFFVRPGLYFKKGA